MSRSTTLLPALAAGVALATSVSMGAAAHGAETNTLRTDRSAGAETGARTNAGRDGIKNPVVAHRGAPRVAPEETLAAYRAAIAEGAAVLEGDVQMTKDGELVLVHDDTLDTTTDAEKVYPDRAPWAIGDFTLAEIKTLDAGSWVHAKYATETIPTLAEVIELGRGKVGFNLEMKSPQNSPGVATKLAALLKQNGLTDASVNPRTGSLDIAVHSRDEGALREFAAVLPEVEISWLSGGAMLDDARLAELATWTKGVYASPARTTAADIDRAHAAGLKLYSDPVDSPEEIGMAVNQGYDYVITNVPAVAKAVIDGKDPRLGLGGVEIDHVMENPNGEDNQPENGEYIALRNTTDQPVDVSHHSLTDHAANVWLTTGPDAVIQPGSIFRVYVNSGTNRAGAYYNGHPDGILNNTGGDTVALLDEDQQLEDVYSYIVP